MKGNLTDDGPLAASILRQFAVGLGSVLILKPVTSHFVALNVHASRSTIKHGGTVYGILEINTADGDPAIELPAA